MASSNDSRDLLQELNLYFENAVDQISRCQRVGRAGAHGIDRFDERVDQLFGDVARLRNEVREALMRALATAPKGGKKLPIV